MCIWSACRELFAGLACALCSQHLYSKQVVLLRLLTAQSLQEGEALSLVFHSPKGLKSPPNVWYKWFKEYKGGEMLKITPFNSKNAHESELLFQHHLANSFVHDQGMNHWV